jgi:hypothetical protein
MTDASAGYGKTRKMLPSMHAIIRHFALPGAALALVLSAGACGKYNPNLPDYVDDEEGGAGGRRAGGSGGRGGAGGRAAAAGRGGTAAPAPTVRCGDTQCPAPMNLLAALPIPTGLPAPVACCIEDTEQCGTAAMQGATCEPPATPDPRCPDVDLGALARFGGMGMGAEQAMLGCCIDNQCGLNGALFGRGCIENDEAGATLAAVPFVGSFIAVPPARACDEASDEDAGVPD